MVRQKCIKRTNLITISIQGAEDSDIPWRIAERSSPIEVAQEYADWLFSSVILQLRIPEKIREDANKRGENNLKKILSHQGDFY